MRYFLLFLFVIIYFDSSCQENKLNGKDEEIAFINYVIGNEDFKGAIFLINDLKNSLDTDLVFQDSLNFLEAWCYYRIKMLDTASIFFDKVSSSSSVHTKSQFYSAFCKAFTGNYDQSLHGFELINSTDSSIKKLQNLELAGVSLLKKDFTSFDFYSSKFKYSYFPVAMQEKNLIKYYDELKNFKPKSMLVAGTLSALVPGLGKIYAGRLGDGIAAFMIATSIGLVTFENFKKDGLLDPKTILFGSIFTTYYVGNIWGSIFSVKMYRDEFYDEINYNILFDLHIPIRSVFN